METFVLNKTNQFTTITSENECTASDRFSFGELQLQTNIVCNFFVFIVEQLQHLFTIYNILKYVTGIIEYADVFALIPDKKSTRIGETVEKIDGIREKEFVFEEEKPQLTQTEFIYFLFIQGTFFKNKTRRVRQKYLDCCEYQ